MASHLATFVVFLLSNILVCTAFSEGNPNSGVVIVNCDVNEAGLGSIARNRGTLPINTEGRITYFNVQTNPGTDVSKVGGGVGNNYVNFQVHRYEPNGLKFHIDMRGNKPERQLTNQCIKS